MPGLEKFLGLRPGKNRVTMEAKGETFMKKRITSLILIPALCAALICGGLPSAAAETNPAAATVTTSSGGLNVRTGPGTGFSILTSLPKGTAVAVTGEKNGWRQVEYAAGKYGWCSAAYLTVLPVRSAAVATDGYRLNIRAGAGTGYAVLGQFADNAKVTVLSLSGGWAKVLFNGTRTGWVSADYLSFSRAAVTLSVPRYGQNDPRWAAVRLGRSSDTVGSAGCTTCSMAMVESYVRGAAVTPAMMAAELTYSSSGTLYWPARYTAYSGDDYLEIAYGELLRGRPVMIGGFTPSGAQHWVVITGFTGGDLIPEHFLINDPGTYARTTLASFQSRYSVFYKIMLRD